MTRQEYMADPTRLHRAYYGQFVTESVKQAVLAAIPLSRLLKSRDPHFNDIPINRWDDLFTKVHGYDRLSCRNLPEDAYVLLKPAGETNSQATGVCIAKEAARQLLEEAGRDAVSFEKVKNQPESPLP